MVVSYPGQLVILSTYYKNNLKKRQRQSGFLRFFRALVRELIAADAATIGP
jgi:hypothetical protein